MSQLKDKEFLRYNRHVMVERIGEAGQVRFKRARVIIIGMGGLGCPAAQYLTASGVGHLVLVDHDRIELSNLQRQVLYREQDIGKAKVEVAKQRLTALNTLVKIDAMEDSIFDIDLYQYLQDIDIVLDCTDSAKTRSFINQLCVETKTRLVSASAIQGQGQLISFDLTKADSPCYHCLFPNPKEQTLNCSTAGVFSPLLGVMGSMQAAEALRLILGETDNLNRLSLFDTWGMVWKKFKVPKDPNCDVCG